MARMLKCNRVNYGGSEIIKKNTLLGNDVLKIKMGIDYSSLTSERGGDVQFRGGLQGAFIFGKVRISFTSKTTTEDVKIIGEFGFVNPNADGGSFAVTIPLTPTIRELLIAKWTKGILWIEFVYSTTFVVLPDAVNPFSSTLFSISSGTKVIHSKPQYPDDTSVMLEEDTLETIASLDLEYFKETGGLWEKLTSARNSLTKNNVEGATLLLRNLIMNHLTDFDDNRDTGKKRFIKEALKNQKLAFYDNEELEVQTKLLKDTEKLLQSNLDILHKFVKDEKIIKIPDQATISLVYSNLIAIMRYLLVTHSSTEVV